VRARAIVHRAQPLSLDAPLPEGERLRREWREDPAAIVGARDQTQMIHGAIAQLPARERDIIRSHYFGEHSLRDIGKRMTISAQRASQLHIAAMSRLRKVLRAPAR
jgi:RNA polymerase sigma factor (sigma-70 family)